jgi:hypothetical protein
VATTFLASARLRAMASLMLIVGAFDNVGCSGSDSFGRRWDGGLATDLVRDGSEGRTRAGVDWEDFALVETVRGRTAGEFGGRVRDGEAVERGEGTE